MLHFDGSWRFDSRGPVPQGVVRAFSEFISKIAGQADRQRILERFKRHFASAAGRPYIASSNVGWAESDLDRYMADAAENGPLFIDAFYSACQELEAESLAVPDAHRINRVLAEHAAGYEIRPPDLVATTAYTPISVPERTPSLSAEAKAIAESSLEKSAELLNQGEGRRAVQEILWLFETVSTAFRDDSTVTGKYFNEIVGELRVAGRGTAQEQILKWMTTLHGYLSSPTGGGVRHGMDLKAGVAILREVLNGGRATGLDPFETFAS
jgi:hypothetical protein